MLEFLDFGLAKLTPVVSTTMRAAGASSQPNAIFYATVYIERLRGGCNVCSAGPGRCRNTARKAQGRLWGCWAVLGVAVRCEATSGRIG
jgi:hypothetical protein